MYINEYALEVMAKTRLAELRADAARRSVLNSLGSPRSSVWAALGAMLHRDGRGSGGRKVVTPRHA